MMTEIMSWFRYFLFRKRPNELDDELQFHLELSIAAK